MKRSDGIKSLIQPAEWDRVDNMLLRITLLFSLSTTLLVVITNCIRDMTTIMPIPHIEHHQPLDQVMHILNSIQPKPNASAESNRQSKSAPNHPVSPPNETATSAYHPTPSSRLLSTLVVHSHPLPSQRT